MDEPPKEKAVIAGLEAFHWADSLGNAQNLPLRQNALDRRSKSRMPFNISDGLYVSEIPEDRS
jgi:hypothetical protein